MAISSLDSHEVLKLDKHDKRIFFRLAQNSRIKKSDLAKELKISLPHLHYKLKRLEQELQEPVVLLNFIQLGYNPAVILADKIDESLMKSAKEKGLIYMIMELIGEYQYFILPIVKDIRKFCSQFLIGSKISVIPILKFIPDEFNPFGYKDCEISSKEDKPIVLDKKDYKILAELSKSPLASFLEINRKTKIARVTIAEKISRMQKANIIQKFRTALNTFKLGLKYYFLRIEVMAGYKEKVLYTALTNNFSGFIYETYTGFFMHYIPPSEQELHEFVKQLKSLEGTIKIELMPSVEIHEINAVPNRVKEDLKSKSM